VAAILVYAELSEGKVATTSLELMAKARELGDVYAVALGSGANAAAVRVGRTRRVLSPSLVWIRSTSDPSGGGMGLPPGLDLRPRRARPENRPPFNSEAG